MELKGHLKSQLRTKRTNTRILSEISRVSVGILKTWLAGFSQGALSDARTICKALGISFEYPVFNEESESTTRLHLGENEQTNEGMLKIEIPPLNALIPKPANSAKKRKI